MGRVKEKHTLTVNKFLQEISSSYTSSVFHTLLALATEKQEIVKYEKLKIMDLQKTNFIVSCIKKQTNSPKVFVNAVFPQHLTLIKKQKQKPPSFFSKTEQQPGQYLRETLPAVFFPCYKLQFYCRRKISFLLLTLALGN